LSAPNKNSMLQLKNMNTNKFQSNYTVVLLAVVFLTMQWGNIHLAESHSHDGTHHEHQPNAHANKAHTHNFLADLDAFHQANHTHAIEVEKNYRIEKREKQKIFYDVSAIVAFPLPPPQISKNNRIAKNTILAYCCYSTLNPRAPPKTV